MKEYAQALEVARARTQARFYHQENKRSALDYRAVFHQFPPPISQFTFIRMPAARAKIVQCGSKASGARNERELQEPGR